MESSKRHPGPVNRAKRNSTARLYPGVNTWATQKADNFSGLRSWVPFSVSDMIASHSSFSTCRDYSAGEATCPDRRNVSIRTAAAIAEHDR